MRELHIGRAIYRGGRRDAVVEVRELEDEWDARFLDDCEVAVVDLTVVPREKLEAFVEEAVDGG